MSTTDADIYIGLDLGTSGLKGVAVSASGAVVARGSAGYESQRPAPGAVEQMPDDWIAAAESVAGQLRSAIPARLWRGIGLSAMIPTLATANGGGEPTGPAITWQDSRSDRHGTEFRERCGGDALYQATGQWVDGRYLLPMYLRAAAEEPSRAAETSWLLGAKDYLFGWLTGVLATDPSTATGFGCYELAGGWNSAALAAASAMAGQALPSLPPLLPSVTWRLLRGEAAARLGCAQIPVCLGAADSVLGALGLGACRPGQVAYIAGTSNVILAVTGRPVLDPAHRFMITPLSEPGSWGLEMDLLATGGAIRWLAGLLSDEPDEAALVALATATDPRDAPIILPYLSPGEQGALWDPDLHGTFVGVRLSHERRHLARGLLNGIVLESRRCLSVLAETGDFGCDLDVGGGSAADPGFRADLADATRCRVRTPSDQDTDYSARGAALLAALGIDGKRLPSRAGSGLMADPDPVRAAQWDVLWADYEQARHAITSHYHRAVRPDSTR